MAVARRHYQSEESSEPRKSCCTAVSDFFKNRCPSIFKKSEQESNSPRGLVVQENKSNESCLPACCQQDDDRFSRMSDGIGEEENNRSSWCSWWNRNNQQPTEQTGCSRCRARVCNCEVLAGCAAAGIVGWILVGSLSGKML